MKKFILLFFAVAVMHGCAHKKYGSWEKVGVVDTETKVMSSDDSLNFKFSYDGGEILTVSPYYNKSQQVKRREKIKEEQCWTVSRGLMSQTNDPFMGLLFALPLDIASIPFAILEKPVRPGCNDRTYWTNWQEMSTPEYSMANYSGPVELSASGGGLRVEPEHATVSGGSVNAKLLFGYPYLPKMAVKNGSNLPSKSFSITARTPNGASSTSIDTYDVSSILAQIISDNFDTVDITVADRNSRYPISQALVSITMDSSYNIEKYLASLKIPKQYQGYVTEFLSRNYGNVLSASTFTVSTDSRGKFSVVVPKKWKNQAKKIELRHPDYYYREIAGVTVAKNMKLAEGVPNHILMDDLGGKVRSEKVSRN